MEDLSKRFADEGKQVDVTKTDVAKLQNENYQGIIVQPEESCGEESMC